MDGVWNLRPIPARTMRNSAIDVISMFLNLIEPLLAAVRPQIRSSRVVLPAPLAAVHVEIESIDGFKAVERDAQVFDRQQEVGIAHHGLPRVERLRLFR